MLSGRIGQIGLIGIDLTGVLRVMGEPGTSGVGFKIGMAGLDGRNL